ncbi:MAG: PsiF family protein [Rhodocyclaceae bacterium]|nr:PsiF family protein [Rhodocyclaceae bacterium]MDZ4075191.1 PsiF family protein [Hylemonella sp.]
MKKLLSLLALGLSLSLGVAHADEEKKAPTAQQNKMGMCNKEAGDKKGDERKAFMSECLKAKPAAAKATPQQERMKKCNADATGKAGDERKKFMSQCLSNK